MKRIRVCHFAASAGLGRGEFYVDLANEQSRRGDLQVSLLVPHDALFLERVAPTVEVIKYRGGRSRRNPFFLIEIAKALRAWKPDVVHTHFAKASEVFNTIRNWVPAKWVASKHNPRPGPIFEKVPTVIAVSKNVADNLKRKDARIIYNGMEFGPKPKVDRRMSKQIRILSVGRLEAVKAFDELIRALAKTSVDWKLQLAGEGTARGELEKLIRELNLEHRVELLGFRSDVPELLAACDVYVQSSISEGFGVALLEAMHFAPLTISTSVGIAAEIFPGWLVWNRGDWKELDEMLKRREDLTKRFAPWAAMMLPRFTLGAVAEEHVRLYRELLEAQAQSE